MRQKQLKVVVCSFTAVLALIAAGIAVAQSSSSEEVYGRAGNYPTNEDGLTYGSVSGAEFGEEPDLIVAQATNGKVGYIYTTDLYEADGTNVTDPDQIAARAHEQNDKLARAFAEELNKLGADAAVCAEDVEEALGTGAVDALILGEADGSESDAAASAAFLEGFSADEVEEAYLNARDACKVYIPVYELDGTTVIGEFPIG